MYPYYDKVNQNGDRFFVAAPFLLGALTGGVAAAAFNPYRPRPYYPVNNYYARPYPYANPYPYPYNYNQQNYYY